MKEANLSPQANLFPPETAELKIEYKGYLTPEQVAVFYNGLNEILSQYNINDAKFVIEKGSLKTAIISCVIGIASLLIGAYVNPQSTSEIKNSLNFTNSFNHNNFSLFAINHVEVYTDKNIAQKHQEIQKIQKENEAKNINGSSKDIVETLQMIITSEKITEITENKAGKVKKSKKFQFTAKFNDSRYLNFKDEIKIITTDLNFRNIQHTQAHEYYFIADGVLHKSNGKYIKFEITNLIKVPSHAEKPQGDLFERYE
jgi:hypothetical protein